MKTIFLDGAMGTMLQNKNLKPGENPALLNITNPQAIKDIHLAYINAGSDVIYTNTFGANELKLSGSGYTVEEIISSGVKIARQAVEQSGKSVRIALNIGSTGELLEPMGSLPFQRAYEIFKRMVVEGAKQGVDIVALETISDLYEAKAAVLAAKENCNKPVFCTMTFEKDMRTFTGCGVSNMALTLQDCGVDYLGINCSLGPVQLIDVVKELIKWTNLPLIIKPNAGLPVIKDKDGVTEFDITPEEFVLAMDEISKMGVAVLGGCCGTNPQYIAMLKEKISDRDVAVREKVSPNYICSSTKTVSLSHSSTGLLYVEDEDIDTLVDKAMEIIDNGIEVLEINAIESSQKELLPKLISEIQNLSNIPLNVKADKASISIAKRIYNGKIGY